MNKPLRSFAIPFVVGLVLGLAGPSAAWLGARSDAAACNVSLTDAQGDLEQALEAGRIARGTAEKDLTRARAGGAALRSLSDVAEDNYGLARDRLNNAASALEAAGETDAANRMRAVSLSPGDEVAAQVALLSQAAELLGAE